MFKRISAAVIAIIAIVLLSNASFLSKAPEGKLKILSHRGVHQTFYREGLTNDTCTAERIRPVTHTYIENTLPSIERAFELGADMVEIDVRRTKDDQFAVFHDHMLDCRTNGVGMIADANMDALRELDLGYGYTSDDGETFPLRGTGVGLMMSLDELIRARPDSAFLINVKSNAAEDADAFHEYLERFDVSLNADTRLWAGPNFADRSRTLMPFLKVGSRRAVKACAKDYVSWGWMGHIPQTCSDYGLVVPQSHQWLYWGWPRKTQARFREASIPVLLVGPMGGENEGIETLEQVDAIPDDYRGWIMTNKIEIIAPAIETRTPS
ncbi:MAG: glycerophosphodiester phosphodiesterase family protein [Pseudomonadota bacterium]